MDGVEDQVGRAQIGRPRLPNGTGVDQVGGVIAEINPVACSFPHHAVPELEQGDPMGVPESADPRSRRVVDQGRKT